MKFTFLYLYRRGIAALKERSFRRYVFAGISTVVLDYLLLVVMRMVFTNSLIHAVTIAYWTSIIYNFLLNKYWSFEDTKSMKPKQVIQYVCLLLFNYLVTLSIVWGLEVMGLSEYIGKLIALVITISWTYLIYKKIIFVKET